jgi:hypothetical protein
VPDRQSIHGRRVRLLGGDRDAGEARTGSAAYRSEYDSSSGGLAITDDLTPGRLANVRLDSISRLEFEHVAADRIVEIDGTPGVFTPLVGVDPKDALSTDNLQKVVDVLRSQVGRLQLENAELTAKVADLTAPARSTDDFAAGMQHSLDVLQARLASMDNEVSNFAVREFQLESKVLVDVTPVGTIGFRFVQPGDQVEAAALSTLSVTVVPVPKPLPDEEMAVPLAPANPGVEAIEGLSDPQVAALRSSHIATVAEFRRAATEATATATLVSMLGVDRDALGRFTLLAGLLTVPGIDRRQAAVLFDAGFTDVASLAATTPAALVRAYAKAAGARPDDDGTRPTKDEAAAWIDAAKQLTAEAQPA